MVWDGLFTAEEQKSGSVVELGWFFLGDAFLSGFGPDELEGRHKGNEGEAANRGRNWGFQRKEIKRYFNIILTVLF